MFPCREGSLSVEWVDHSHCPDARGAGLTTEERKLGSGLEVGTGLGEMLWQGKSSSLDCGQWGMQPLWGAKETLPCTWSAACPSGVQGLFLILAAPWARDFSQFAT